jgi:glycosyltransferase involved in cell wall biosynthesis
MKISICVPTYEMYGKGLIFLKRLIKSVLDQTHNDWELIISDDSKNTEIKEYIISINDNRIKYIKNEDNRKISSVNLNNAIKNASGEIIKPIFQDDFIYDKNCLYQISSIMSTSNRVWGSCGFVHTDEFETFFCRYMLPSINPHLLQGVNTLGCPSNIFFLKSCDQFFDEALQWLMDCEFYYRLNTLSFPVFINSPLMATRIWNDSVSNHITDEIKINESNYVKGKFNV